MNMARVQKNIKRIGGAIILLTAVVPGLSGLQAYAPPSSPEEAERAQYFRLAESIVTAAADDQRLALQSFLLSHPQHERIYLKLLERYQAHGRIREAKAFFQGLATNPPYQRNSRWILARIAMLETEDDAPAAFDNFLKALSAGRPSADLLRDFIEFDIQKAETFNGFEMLKTPAFSPENQKIVAALYAYQRLHFARQKLDAGQVDRAFREIPAENSHDAVVLHAWGDHFYRTKRYNAADSLWRLGLSISRRRNDLELQALFFTNLGIAANATQRSNLALSYYDSAYAVVVRTDDLYNRQRVLGFHSNISYARGQYDEVVALAKEAGKLAVVIGAYNTAATWFANAGQALYELGRFNEALEAYEKSEKYARRINNQDLLIRLKLRRAAIYSDLSLNDIAKNILLEADRLAEQKGYFELSLRAQVVLADIMVEAGKYNEARTAYKKFIAFLEQTDGFPVERHNILAKIADTYKAERDDGKAIEYYRQAQQSAEATGSAPFAAWYRLDIANIEMSQGKWPEAMQRFLDVLEFAKSMHIPEMQVRVYIELGDAYQKMNDLNKAIMAYSQAANVIESTRTDLSVDALRIGYFSEKSRVYRRLADAFFKRYQAGARRFEVDSLFFYAQMTQGRALYDLRYLRARPDLTDKNPLNQEYLRACAQLEELQRAIRLHPDQFDRWREQWEPARYSVAVQRLRLVEQYDAANPRTQTGARPLAAIQKLLAQNDLGLLLYQISEDNSYVVVVDGKHVGVVPLNTRADLLAAMVDSLIMPFHLANEQTIRQTPFRAALAHRLYRLLVEPAEKAMKLPERLLVVPDLVLLSLPFEMLLTAAPSREKYLPTDKPAYADDFLAQRYTVVYSPTVSLLQVQSRADEVPPNVLVFANPFSEIPSVAAKRELRSGLRFDALPFSQEEARRIEKVYPATTAFVRDEASEAAFRRAARDTLRTRIFHIASHAFVDTTFDAFSGLVLAAGLDSTDDGILMGYEIADLRLTCDLMVLSACKTGSGKFVMGEGVLGLQRLFLGTGAKSVLMTLWQVFDQFPAVLMPEFYERFLNDGRSKADALTEAKRALLDGNLEDAMKPHGIYYEHPFFWATFVLYGDPGINRGLSGPSKLALYSAAFLILALLVTGVYYLRHRRNRMQRTKLKPLHDSARMFM